MHNIIILIIVIIPNIMLGQQTTIENILKDYFKELDKVECKYKQEKEMIMLKESLISTGIFQYQKGKGIIMQQESPFKEIYRINTDSEENKFERDINQFIISILNGKILENKNIDIKYSENKDQYLLIMKPKRGVIKRKIRKIDLIFTKEIISLERLEIALKNNDVTKINFYGNE